MTALRAMRSAAADVDPKAATIAGLAAGMAFLAVLEADVRLTGNTVDDLVLLGRPVARSRERARPVGLAFHFANSVGFAFLYALLERRLAGPPWWRGVLFFNVENVVIYPVLVFEEWHPAIRDGQLDRYWTWPSFLQSIPRHVAFGAVLGPVYARLQRR